MSEPTPVEDPREHPEDPAEGAADDQQPDQPREHSEDPAEG
jgi:hypothetical protein